MAEKNLKTLAEQPEHFQHAEHFIVAVLGQVAQQYPTLEISAFNLTILELNGFSGVAKVADFEGDKEMKQEAMELDHAAEIDSATTTRAFIILQGDKSETMDEATLAINAEAKKLHVNNIFDNGNTPNSARKVLPKILLDASKVEDILMLERYLEYHFK